MYSNILWWLYKVAKFDMYGNFAQREIQTDLLVGTQLRIRTSTVKIHLYDILYRALHTCNDLETGTHCGHLGLGILAWANTPIYGDSH